MRPELHIACAAFPALPEEDLAALAADIHEKGLLEPITLTSDGLLLDGRCRWDACERVGVEPRTVVYDGDDPVGFVASKNRHRRHLSKSQMAMIVGRLATLRPGRISLNTDSVGISPTHDVLSQKSGVSKIYLDCGRAVLTLGAPNVVAMVDTGQVVNVRAAADVVRRYDRATQAAFTASDVVRLHNEIREARPCYQKTCPKAPGKSAKPKSKPRPMINPPRLKMEWPTKEELDYPKEGSSVAEYDAFFAKYGRTPLYPKAIKEMQDADALTSGLANVVRTMTHSHHPKPDQFFDYLDLLATHRREPGQTNGAQTDFANRGRTTLAMLEAALPKALDLLHALQAKLAARGSQQFLPPKMPPRLVSGGES